MVYLPNGTFRWGFQATPESVRKTGTYVQYIKLLLDPSQETNNTLADPLGLTEMRARLPHNKQPVDVVADYLHAIKTHALEVLMKSFGDKFWKVIPIEYHLTIPAVGLSGLLVLTWPESPFFYIPKEKVFSPDVKRLMIKSYLGLERSCQSIDIESSH